MSTRYIVLVGVISTLLHCKQSPEADTSGAAATRSRGPVISNFINDISIRAKLNRPFSIDLRNKIANPNSTKNEFFVQDPMMGPTFVASAIERLRDNGQPGSLALKVEMEYGLNEYTNSYDSKLGGSYTEVDEKKDDSAHKKFLIGTSLNCFVCHSGRVGKDFIPGRGNPRINLRKYIQDIFGTVTLDRIPALYETWRNAETLFFDWKEGTFTPFSNLDMMKDMFLFISNPKYQSITSGTSDPWGFAVQLFNWRKDDMSYRDDSRGFTLQPVSLDPMPWWNLRYKTVINYDGIIRKHPRTVVQASFAPGKSGPEIHELDPFYAEIFKEMDTYTPPLYPNLGKLNLDAVAAGEVLFNRSCTQCHGKYSVDGIYQRDPIEFKKTYDDVKNITPWSIIKTDRQRLLTLNFKYIKQLEKSWLTEYRTVADRRFNYYFVKAEALATPALRKQFEGADDIPESSLDRQKLGYISPPLWGLWASAPYFHNGSVPTLKQFLFPKTREKYWRLPPSSQREVQYDYDNEVGLKYQRATAADQDIRLYDTQKNDGRSNQGHEAQLEGLSDPDRLNLLEYLKTL